MSPVWMMKAGLAGAAVTCATASLSVPTTSGLAALSNPIWESLSWAKVSPSASAASACPISRARGTPPATVQTSPVPAQAMQRRKPRRSIPSLIASLLRNEPTPR
jgi:hypothetical protein